MAIDVNILQTTLRTPSHALLRRRRSLIEQLESTMAPFNLRAANYLCDNFGLLVRFLQQVLYSSFFLQVRFVFHNCFVSMQFVLCYLHTDVLSTLRQCTLGKNCPFKSLWLLGRRLESPSCFLYVHKQERVFTSKTGEQTRDYNARMLQHLLVQVRPTMKPYSFYRQEDCVYAPCAGAPCLPSRPAFTQSPKTSLQSLQGFHNSL